MKKLLFKVIFKFGLTIGVLLAVPYFMMGGQLPSWAANWLPSSLGGGAGSVSAPKNISDATTDEKVTYYRWVDEQGQVHFSSQAPTGQNVEKKTLLPNTNIVKATKIPQPEEDSPEGGRVLSLTKKGGQGGEGGSGSGDDEPFNPYSPDGVKKMIDNAQQAAQMMENRNKQLGKVTGAGVSE